MAIRILLVTAGAWLYVIPASLAQSTVSSHYEDCPPTIQRIIVAGQPIPWYLSLALTDRRSPHLSFGDWVTTQQMDVFLSVPQYIIGNEGNNTSVCTYAMGGLDQKSDSRGDASCNGLLNEACIEAVRHAPLPQDGACPPIDITEACGRGFISQTTTPHNFSSPRCSMTDLPNVDLPRDYRVYGGFPGPLMQPFDDDRKSYEMYDLRVRQPVPMLVTAWTDFLGSSQLVCVAPSDVVNMSREPESDFPSAAGGVEARLTRAFVAGLFGLILLR